MISLHSFSEYEWSRMVVAGVVFSFASIGEAKGDPDQSWSAGYAPPIPTVPWENSLTTALEEAHQDSKPLLLHVLWPFDLSSVVVREWLMTDPALKPVLQNFHCVSISSLHESLKGREIPRGAVVMLGPDGAPWARVKDAPRREKFVAQLKEALADLRPPDELRGAALKDPGNSALVLKAAERLQSAGRLPDAMTVLETAIKAVASSAAQAAMKSRLEFFQALRPTWAWSRLQRGLEVLDQFGRGQADFAAFQSACLAVESALQMEGAGAVLPAAEKALVELKRNAAIHQAPWADGPSTRELFPPQSVEYQGARASLVRTVKDQEQEMVGRGLGLLLKFIHEGKGAAADQLEARQVYLRHIIYLSGKEAEATAFTRQLIRRLAEAQEFPEMIPLLVEAVVQLDLEDENMQLARMVAQNVPDGWLASAASLRLADRAVEQGDLDGAMVHWAAAEKAAEGESEVLCRAARAARSLMDRSASPNRTRWARRKAADVVVLVPDAGAFLRAISRWTEDEFFPVLFQDDLYAARFIEAYHPKTVWIAPPSGTAQVDLDAMRRAALAAWGREDLEQVKTTGSDELVKRLKELGEKPQGTVFVQAGSGEALGGLALAAGRFQGLEPIACTKTHGQPMAFQEVIDLEQQLRKGMARYNLPEADGRWAAITLAGDIPFACAGVEFPSCGNRGAVDDALGRFDDWTRYAAVGRLLGDAPRSVYQAMCALFLNPERALFFNNYGINPQTVWGCYQTAAAAEAFARRIPSQEVHAPENTIAKFRALTGPWNRQSAIFINSSGGAVNWSVGGGGWTDDFPVGMPSTIYIIHSGSAANPYDPDTLAGRAIWGGAFWYFGSTAEPFLAAFQPPRDYAPHLLAGAPWAATFRLRTDDRFWSPWRLMMIGDPLFCLRDAPLARIGYVPAAGEKRLEPIPQGRDLAALRIAVQLGDWKAAGDVLQAAGAGAPCLDNGEALALALITLLHREDYTGAVDRYESAGEDARKNFAARVHARAAAVMWIDQSVANRDLAALRKGFSGLVLTRPPAGFLARQFRTAMDGELFKTQPERRTEFLKDLLAAPLFQSYRSQLQVEQARSILVILAGRPAWTQKEVDEGVTALQELIKMKASEGELREGLQNFQSAYRRLFTGATADSLIVELRKLQAEEPNPRRLLDQVLAEIGKEHSAH